jgi:hypothetical protein
MRIGYARVSTEDQTLDLQRDALKRANCREIYEEHASGKNTARPAARGVPEVPTRRRYADRLAPRPPGPQPR